MAVAKFKSFSNITNIIPQIGPNCKGDYRLRVLVCGSRHFEDIQFVVDTLSDMFDNQFGNKVSCVIHGDAHGVDKMADSFAYFCKVPVEAYPADWKKHGKAAGPIRNKQMLDDGKPDLVIAFLAPDSRGTKNMIEQATKANIPVKVINI